MTGAAVGVRPHSDIAGVSLLLLFDNEAGLTQSEQPCVAWGSPVQGTCACVCAGVATHPPEVCVRGSLDASFSSSFHSLAHSSSV